MDNATKLSNNNRKRYFKILIIDRLISVVKLEILLIGLTYPKSIKNFSINYQIYFKFCNNNCQIAWNKINEIR